MRVFNYKLTCVILVCVILLVFWTSNIISGLTFIQPPWKSATLSPTLYTVINASSPVRSYTNKGSTLNLKADARILPENCGELQDTGKQTVHEHGQLLWNRSLYYCNIPKCGSTFMGVFLQKVFFNDKTNSSKKFMIKLKGLQNISGVFAFMFVREPYSRLFSAYENKLFHPNKFWRGLGTDIIREVRHNASKLSKRLGHDVTFTELIEYVVKLAEQGRQLNEHLAAMHTMCNPCRQHFDFVGKLETMTEDLVYLVHKWKTRGILSNDMIFTEDVEAEIKYERSLGRIQHMFLTYGNNLHLISKYKLFQRTWSSYQIRGMILNDYKMPFDEFNISHVDMKLYTQAVESAMDNSKSYENELKTQRKEALLQAYRTITAEQMDKLRQFVKTDCVIYGYDDRPELLFKRSVPEELRGHDYFKWL